MSDSKQLKGRQHYVPQFYLRYFAPAGSTEQVYVLATSRNEVFGPSAIKGIAKEQFFYDTPGDAEQFVENALETFEGEVGALHARIVRARSLSVLTSEERRTYARFIAIQQRRTKRARDEIKMILGLIVAPLAVDKPTKRQRIHISRTAGPVLVTLEAKQVAELRRTMAELARTDPDQAAAFLKKQLRTIKDVFAKYKLSVKAGRIPPDMRGHFRGLGEDVETIKTQHIRTLGGLSERIADIIETMEWGLIINETSVPFCTSDNPVALIDAASFKKVGLAHPGEMLQLAAELLGHVAWESDGKTNPQLRILFPLNPTLLLLLTPGQRAYRKPVSLTDSKEVMAYNGIQAIQAFERVFGNDAATLSSLSAFVDAGRGARKAIEVAAEGFRLA